MPPPAAATAPPPENDAAETAALISQITSEARASHQSITYDPDAPVVSDDDADAELGRPRLVPGKGKSKAAPGKDPKTGKFTKAKPAAEAGEGDADADDGADDEEAEGDEGDEEKGDDETTHGAFDADAVQAALGAEGGVDMLALAKALGKEPEELGVTPAQHMALRIADKKARKTLERANTLADKLKAEYGDRVAARRALSTGDIDPAIKACEAIFDMPWNELNRAVAASLNGKPMKDLEDKRQLREMKKKEAERAAADKTASEAKAAADKTEQAKAWIGQKIKNDRLASPEIGKLLMEAGFPSVNDLVFEELQKGYDKGLTDPKKALEKVRLRLVKTAKALAAGGLIATAPTPPKSAPMSASRPRASAQAGAAGNAREMTDEELRRSVLKEHGLAK